MPYRISIVFTRHEELGYCTSQNLLRIIEHVKPDVIFEELSDALYEEVYVEGKLNNLESIAIRAYVAKHEVPHIPADTFPRSRQYNEDQYAFNNKLTTGAGYDSAQLRDLLDQLEERVGTFGFSFLNSDNNDVAMQMLETAKQKVLKKLNDPKLDDLYQKDQEVILKREDVMLDNVYRYAKENSFSNGMMFIGSGHRKSIMKKILERNKTDYLKTNWQFYADLNL
jgi:hypothetical protein